jgi:hypothetical protein
MQKIVIAYWHCSQYKDCKYEHGHEIPYTKAAQNKTLDYFMKLGYNVALVQGENLTIYVDKGRFKA